MMALANVTIQAAPISKKSLALCNPPPPEIREQPFEDGKLQQNEI